MTKRERINRRSIKTPDKDSRRQANLVPGASDWAALQKRVGNRALQRMLEPTSETEPEQPAEAVKLPSGASWVDRFPVSEDVNDLDSGFLSDLREFRSVLEEAGAELEILTTRVPPERAYLMHWAWRIAKEGFDPRQVPYMDGVDVRWWHGDMKTSQDAAWSMVLGYEIDDLDDPPPHVSAYTEGQVIAMRIRWTGALTLYRDEPQEQIIDKGPNDGTNPAIIALAELHGLEHLLTVPDSDEVHWAMAGSDAEGLAVWR
jgi:hypothetical protein